MWKPRLSETDRFAEVHILLSGRARTGTQDFYQKYYPNFVFMPTIKLHGFRARNLNEKPEADP